MTLDLNQLQVDSFSTSAAGDPSQWGLAAEPTTGTMTYAFCVENGTVADTYVSCIVQAGDALTEAYPCKTTR
jgi:hypothetical protein